MINPNIFQVRNDWNVKEFRCKKTTVTFQSRLEAIIRGEVGVNSRDDTNYQGAKQVQSRQLFVAFMVRHNKGTLSSIGRILGKDHSTVISSIKAVSNMYDTDKSFREMYNRIETKLNNH